MDVNNPLLVRTGFPRFDLIRAEHVVPAVDQILTQAREILSQIEQNTIVTWESLMDPLEEIDLLFEYGWSPVTHLLSVRNADDLREAHEKVLPAIVEFRLQLRQSEAIYRKLCTLRDSESWRGFSSSRKRIIEQSIQSAEQSGISLQGEKRARFNEIEHRLSQLATDFSNHVLDATKSFCLDLTDPADVDGFPASLRRLTSAAWNNSNAGQDTSASTPESGPWRITLEIPCFGPFMEHCRNASLREQLYRAYISRASAGDTDNCPLIAEILQLRREKAGLLGYDDYAHLSLSRKMAGDPDRVQQMFEQLRTASFEVGRKELQELTEAAVASGHTGPLAHWDIAFWAERLREQRFAYTDEQLRPYFSLPRVLDGLFSLCHQLFGITVRPTQQTVPLWHEDVRFFDVLDETGTTIAGFYLDPYSRPADKRPGAWMNDCIARSFNEKYQRLPIAHLICNGTPPVGDVPSLMTFREVETLFHEFGHGLQHMLTTVNERDASGINGVEWDAVELPSQFMEYWCYHRPTLMGMAIHYESGESLPEELYQKLCRARTYRAASQMLRQLQFGMTDMELHSHYDPNGQESPFDVERRIAKLTSVLAPLPENRFLCSFQHIFAGGYAAGYYSYKWAEVLSADAFSAFEDAGLDDNQALQQTGRRFRDTVLAQGGSRHPMDIFREFRGREPDPGALLRQYGLFIEQPAE
ncbi:MAG: M3 family metallopeptidase [Planctomycetaceae bacterium]|nr:M3 family metallopeptidase [Planctomycetaceae bacterium]